MGSIQQSIGGVFALEETARQPDSESLLARWSKGAKASHLFHNARSALHHVLLTMAPKRCWLPAYLCPEILQAVPDGLTVRYYPVGSALDPEFEALENRLQPGDAVLGIAYFGRPMPVAWHALVQRRPDIVWIEDCAQALDNSERAFPYVRIFSPRKLLGAPDGGVLVDCDGRLPAPFLEPIRGDTFIEPYRLRAADPAGDSNDQWYAAFRAAEDLMAVSLEAISDKSRKILEQTPVAPLIEARRRNYRVLLETLSAHALFDGAPDEWAPLGFPMRFAGADALCTWLADRRIFIPRHWRNLPSPTAEFPEEHALSQDLLTLPCDQRYGEDGMRYMADLVTNFIG